MSVLVIGADRIEPIRTVLSAVGAGEIEHWDARNRDITRKKIPQKTECVIFLTDFLSHNAMNYFKREAERRQLRTIFAKRSVSCVFEGYCKAYGLASGCDACTCQYS